MLNVRDDPLSVEMAVMKQNWFERRRAALQLLAFVAGLLLVWREWRRAETRTLRLTVGLALALGAVTSLMVAHRTLHYALIAIVPAVLLWLLVIVLRKLWRVMPPPLPLAESGTTAARGTATVVALALLAGQMNGLAVGIGESESDGAFSTLCPFKSGDHGPLCLGDREAGTGGGTTTGERSDIQG